MSKPSLPNRLVLALVSPLAGALVLFGTGYFGAEGTAAAKTQAALAAALLGFALGGVFAGLELMIRPRLAAPLSRAFDRSGLRAAIGRDPEAPRATVVDFHAAAIGLTLGVAFFAQAFTLYVERLRKIQSQALAERLTMIGAVGLALLSLLIGFGLRALVRRPLTRFDQKRPLPWPHRSALTRVVWIALPLGVFALLALRELGRVLGPLAAPLVLLLFVALRVMFVSLLGGLSARVGERWQAKLAVFVPLLAICVGTAGANWVLSARPEAVYALDSAPVPAWVVRSARSLTDFDRDGVSSLFGGKDCAPFSAARHPGARDIVGNGVDEDCDGVDATEQGVLPTGPRYRSLSATAPERLPDVVWFVIDALRADHTGVYGYRKATTPYLDALAKESVVFEDALSQSSATMLSFPSMLTGVDPGSLTWELEQGKLQVRADQQLISERLVKLGYQTGFVASDYFRKRLPGLLQGWSWVDYLPAAQKISSARSAALAARFISRSLDQDKPFFLVVYLPAPHAPYVEHEHAYPAMGKAPNSKYDAEIANADRYMGFVLDLLREDQQRYANTVVIATGDHGEEFAEHGGKEHARTCHSESVHVPLVVKLPKQEAVRVPTRVGLVDIVPMLLELTGAERPAEPLLDGHSLLLALSAPETLPADRPFFCSVVSQKAAQGDFFRRAVRSGKWSLQKEMRGSLQLSLYDTEADPGEQAPLPLEGEAKEVATRLDSWLGLQLRGNLESVPLTED